MTNRYLADSPVFRNFLEDDQFTFEKYKDEVTRGDVDREFCLKARTVNSHSDSTIQSSLKWFSEAVWGTEDAQFEKRLGTMAPEARNFLAFFKQATTELN